MVGGLLDGAQLACGAAKAVAVQAGLRPSPPQTKSRKLSNLRQVPQTLGRVRVVLLGLLNVFGGFRVFHHIFMRGRKNMRLGRPFQSWLQAPGDRAHELLHHPLDSSASL